MQGNNWDKADMIGTMEDWESEIPKDEARAMKIGWLVWYVSDERYEYGHLPWLDYRDELLGQLNEIEIIDENKPKQTKTNQNKSKQVNSRYHGNGTGERWLRELSNFLCS